MALRLDDKWIWDFWFARDGEDHHVYFLQADRSLGDPEQRHWSVSIGHAVSRDLISWEVLGTCLTPSPSPAWDDCTTWTGSVKRHPDGYWCLYYTGTSRADNGLRQRIGMATSRDLHNWEKHDGNPILCVDPAHYETLNTELWHDQAWRDPWVIPDPDGTHYHMFFTARTNHGSGDARGCIGHAVSNDLHTWESRPPVWAGELY
ncbi:MAG: glycoside hydrolase family 68 protein, partial [Ectothiorhodospiraceae bacterium]